MIACVCAYVLVQVSDSVNACVPACVAVCLCLLSPRSFTFQKLCSSVDAARAWRPLAPVQLLCSVVGDICHCRVGGLCCTKFPSSRWHNHGRPPSLFSMNPWLRLDFPVREDWPLETCLFFAAGRRALPHACTHAITHTHTHARTRARTHTHGRM